MPAMSPGKWRSKRLNRVYELVYFVEGYEENGEAREIWSVRQNNGETRDVSFNTALWVRAEDFEKEPKAKFLTLVGGEDSKTDRLFSVHEHLTRSDATKDARNFVKVGCRVYVVKVIACHNI